MKRLQNAILPLLLTLLFALSLTVPAFAITESEVEAQVAASSKESVTGNVPIWFLCAVAFLKVSQKVDSFLSSLGVNVGHTGGSMLSDAMVVLRTIKMATGPQGGSKSAAPISSRGESSGPTGFFQGGLAGIASRKVTNDALKTATMWTSNVRTAQNTSAIRSVHTASEIHSGGSDHTSSEVYSGSTFQASSVAPPNNTEHPVTIAAANTLTQTEHIGQDGTIQTNPSVQQPSTAIPSDHTAVQSSYAESTLPAGTILADNSPLTGIATVGAEPIDSHILPTAQVSPVASGTAGTVQQEGIIQTDNTPPAESHVAETPPIGSAPYSEAPPITTVHASDNITRSSQIMPAPPDSSGLRSDGTIQASNATSPGQALHTSSQKQVSSEAVTSSVIRSGNTLRTDSSRVTSSPGPVSLDTRAQQNTVEKHSTHTRTQSSSTPALPRIPSLGGMMFTRSLQSGGRFANDVIGTVARGDTRATGTMTGEMAAQDLTSYMGIATPGEKTFEKVSYSQVEIGGGKIFGTEFSPEHPEGIAFGMYHTDQYTEPKGLYEKITTADGAKWYKQFAVDTLVKTPFKTPDGKIDYNNEIVKRLSDPPRRKDKM